MSGYVEARAEYRDWCPHCQAYTEQHTVRSPHVRGAAQFCHTCTWIAYRDGGKASA